MYLFNEKVFTACLCDRSHNCTHCGHKSEQHRREKAKEENNKKIQKTKVTKEKAKDTLDFRRQEKKYFKKEEVINISGIHRLGRRSTEDLLRNLIQRMSLVTLTTMMGGEWWWQMMTGESSTDN